MVLFLLQRYYLFFEIKLKKLLNKKIDYEPNNQYNEVDDYDIEENKRDSNDESSDENSDESSKEDSDERNDEKSDENSVEDNDDDNNLEEDNDRHLSLLGQRRKRFTLLSITRITIGFLCYVFILIPHFLFRLRRTRTKCFKQQLL